MIGAFVAGGALVGSGFLFSGKGGQGLIFTTDRGTVDTEKMAAYAERRDVEITRCEFAKLLVENLGLTAEYMEISRVFSDVPVGHQCRRYAAIVSGSSHNIMNGFSDGTFRPDQPLTRGEAVKYAIIGADLSENLDHVSQFSDIAAHWVSGFASTAYHWGLLAKNREACYPRELSPDQMAKKNWAKMLIKNAADPYAID